MTLAASSQRSQIIRSKFRSVLQLRIHRRNQDCTSDSDPWISASGPALAPALPPVPASFLVSPGILSAEPAYCPWRSPKKESSKNSQHWKEPKVRGNLTYHLYMPPEGRQGPRADLQAEGSTLGPPGPPLWEEKNSQSPHPRMKPSSPGDSSPSPPSHKLELQTLKLEELTVSELRQQLRLRGLPVSGTKATLLERMRGGVPPRERQKPRREDKEAAAPWPRLRPKALGPTRRPGTVKARTTTRRLRFSGTTDPLRAPALASAPAPAPAPVPAPTPFPASSPATLTLEEELQEAIHRAQLLPNRNIDDILEDHVEPDDLLPPISLDFPGSFDVLSPSPDSEGFSSVFSSSLPSPTSSLSPSPRALTDSLDWLETLSGGPPLGSGPPGPSIFSADVSDSTSTGLWELLPDAW
ncbi:MEF2-activating motif and SAP domain-containing transcriptional regulator isoform X2 [Cricetulus griseus]|uniref:MEF2-activating motif and SAP domain-containing transcriptional regulator n=1 Tax=Cricetulus griseus TaxID=10029 RepID=A0A061HXJ0_CRIGR|nr:MEF2-activating motif and SAP domain-containing transcriptional regulator isoform X2 [Cricetulus griseus]ERE71124.1 MEF2-activating motif and SAP domain-containing transcriptional regulator-like protein [Cricetulus griseus]